MKLFTHEPSPDIALWDDMTDLQKKRMRENTPDDYEALLYKVIGEKAKRSFWYFLTRVVENRALLEELHAPIAEWLEEWKKRRKLLLVARGHVKSNIASVAFPAWCIANNRNLRILIDSHTDPDAKKFAAGAAAIIRSPLYQRIFPHIRPAMNGWRPACWRANRYLIDRDVEALEGAIETSSLEKQVTGRHYNIIISDDLVTARNVNTPEQILATKEYYRHAEALLDPGGYRLVVGTPYDYNDFYGEIRTTPELRREFEFFIQPADCVVNPYSPDLEVVQDGVAVYSSRYTMDADDIPSPDGDPLKHRTSLPRLKSRVGTWIYNSQYRLDPISPENATFQKEDVEAMEIDCLPENVNLNYFRVCDLSTEKATKDSRTAIITYAMDPHSTAYVVDIFLGNYTSQRIVQELIRGQQVPENIRPQRVGFEPAAHERVLKSYLDLEMQRTETWVPRVMIPNEAAQVNKDNRIRGLQGFVQDRKIRVLKTCPHKNKLYEELLRHPRGAFKDIIDALANIYLVAYPPKEAVVETNTEKPNEVQRAFAAARRNTGNKQPIGATNVMDRETSLIVMVGNGGWE